MFITVSGSETIPDIPESEMQGPGTYEIEDGEILSFTPLPAPFNALSRTRRPRRIIVMPIEAPQSDSERSSGEQSNAPLAPLEQTQPLLASQSEQGEVVDGA